MATTIVTKNGSGAPTASDLVAGELAVDLTNGRLYTEDLVGTVLELGLNPSGNVNVTGSVTASADITISNGNNRFVASSTSAGDYVRMYGGSGTGKWDIYGNGANLRIGDNESAGLVQIDTDLYTVGNVGIGTSSPLQALHVNSGTGNSAAIFESTDSTSQIWIKDSASSSTYQTGIGCLGDNLLFNNGGEKMRIDASGDIRLTGTAPNAEDAISAINFFNSSAGTNLASIIGKRTAGGTSYGSLIFNTTNVGTAAERMRLESSGNLLVGKTSTGINTAGHELFASGEVFHSVAGTPLYVNRIGSDGPIQNFYKDGTTVGSIGSFAGSKVYIGSPSSAGAVFSTNGVMPVTDGALADNAHDLGQTSARWKDLYLSGVAYAGELIVGNTVVPSASSGGAAFDPNTNGRAILKLGTTSTANQGLAEFFNPNGQVGGITTNGSATSYNTSSDQRLKENIADADDAGSKIDAIQVRKFDWKADGQHQDYGMVAQELQTVAPEAVSAPEDPEEMMGVDYSKLVPMMLKEIQSLRARIAALES